MFARLTAGISTRDQDAGGAEPFARWEHGVGVDFSYRVARPVTASIHSELNRADGDGTLRLAVVSVILAAAALATSEWLERRGVRG